MRLALFTGSRTGDDPGHAAGVAALATALAEQGHGIVFGGGRVGLMGVIADAALAAGGEVIGVAPAALVEREVAHRGLTRLEVVDTMHERKARMVELADAMVALPGGVGTLDELFEAWTWQLLGIHAKAVALYDLGGYWERLLGMLAGIAESGFLSRDHLDSLIVEREPAALLDALERWRPPRQRWRDR